MCERCRLRYLSVHCSDGRLLSLSACCASPWGWGEKDVCMLGMDVKEVIVEEWGKQKGLGGVTQKGGRGFKSNEKKEKEKKLHTVKICYCIYCAVPF